MAEEHKPTINELLAALRQTLDRNHNTKETVERLDRWYVFTARELAVLRNALLLFIAQQIPTEEAKRLETEVSIRLLTLEYLEPAEEA